MSETQFRQGDVFLRKIDKLPEQMKEVKPEGDKNILAYGEATGHHHFTPSKFTKLFTIGMGMMILRVMKETELAHQEHGAITLPQGDYEVRRQQEVDLLGQWHRVLD